MCSRSQNDFRVGFVFQTSRSAALERAAAMRGCRLPVSSSESTKAQKSAAGGKAEFSRYCPDFDPTQTLPGAVSGASSRTGLEPVSMF